MLNKKLRIAQIAPLIERVPPKKYGGTERVVSALTEELVRRGHDVTLFATRDSITSANLQSFYPRGLREAKIDRLQGVEMELYNIGRAYMNQDSFDIIHDHNSSLSMPTANLSKTPTVITIHGLIRQNTIKFFENFTNPNYVSISQDQIKHLKNVKNITTIPNGLNFNDNPFGSKHKGYLLFVGRISMLKGLHHAIDVAEQLNIPLIIAAKLDNVDLSYFKEYIEPRLYNDHIKWIGEVDTKQRNKLMSGAICLLNPITWREPFGLTMIEAMACGCPVVAFDNGSISEIVENNKTGYVVRNDQEMIAAVGKIDNISREDCREHALKNFNDRLMTDRYEDLYEKILKRNKSLDDKNQSLKKSRSKDEREFNYHSFMRHKN
ncbi:glycosyltransferase family 4 protein [Patescibacteria group bacterium]|nr:glycosyltransferase family 4 protein [Patescibacteria group bacterium]